MPPTRTFPPAKAIKTERTHEENQERAYIAASRRSDRSLEARVESARRASEIHKRRTGRSLRVTEQDVINEEMYEEEDDDLPMQYRRLTAHLQTGSADFNRRLAAYLTNQVAMRSAVEQMANGTYPQAMSGHPGMMYQQPRPNMFQPNIMQHPQHQMSQPITPGGSYRQVPYPSPGHVGYRPNHGRAYSTAIVPSTTSHTPPTPGAVPIDHRRMSTPATIPPQIDTSNLKSDPDYIRHTQSAQVPFNPFWQESNPFTSTLPPESQQMLAGTQALDPHDPYTSSLMQGSDQYLSNHYYPWSTDTSNGMKSMAVSQSAYPNMSVTLAPSALTSQPESLAATPVSTSVDGGAASTASLDPLGLNHVGLYGKDAHSPHSLPSGQNTPGESFWSNFVQDGGWEGDSISTG